MNEIEKKEIEEMARGLSDCVGYDDWSYGEYTVDCDYTAHKMFEKGYRNVKDKVVLTEEAHEIAMKIQYEVGFNFGCKKMQEKLAKASELKAETIKLAKQEMARDIKNKFRELLSQYCKKISRDFAFKILDETIEQCGVNIEE